jgi:hypothetical protein
MLDGATDDPMQRLDDGAPIDDLSREEVQNFTKEEIEARANTPFQAGMVDATFWCLLIGVSALVKQLITGGLELPFLNGVPPEPPFYAPNIVSSAEEVTALWSEVRTLERRQVLTRPRSLPGTAQPASLIEKANGTFRFIYNARHVKRFVQTSSSYGNDQDCARAGAEERFYNSR